MINKFDIILTLALLTLLLVWLSPAEIAIILGSESTLYTEPVLLVLIVTASMIGFARSLYPAFYKGVD